MRWRVILTLLLFLCFSEARAQITIPNFSGTSGGAQSDWVSQFDTDRNKISATNGSLIQLTPGTYSDVTDCTGSSICFAWYGTDWSCGWRVGNYSSAANPHGPPYCGESVYTSPDLQTWKNHGHMFDVNATNVDDPTHTISAGCAGITRGASSQFCGIVKVRYNPNTGLYVLWDSLPSAGSSLNYVSVFTCTSSIGGCTQHPQITFATTGVTINDLEPLVDGSNIYFFHTDGSSACSSGPCAYVEQMASNGLSVASTLQTFPSIGEGIWAFKVGSTYHYGSGSGCNYCNDAVTQYEINTTNIASWPTSGQAGANVISNSTCNAQNFNVTPISSVALLKATHFFGDPAGGPGFYTGHGLSNEFWYPLTFTGTAINPIVGCPGDSGYPGSLPAVVTVPGITPVTPPPFVADQTSEGGRFVSHCDITPAGTSFPQLSRMQVFTPSQTFTAPLEFSIAECNQHCVNGGLSPSCPAPDSNLLVQVFNTTGSGTSAVPTGSALYTYTGNPQSNSNWAQGSPNPVKWAPQATQMTVTLTGGVTYAMVISAAPGGTVGSYTSTFDQTGTNPYPRGFEAHSSNWPTGNTWTVDANEALKFSAGVGVGPAMLGGGGHRVFR
jgi:hypothetical protein